jgi:hypothetical protein
MANQQGTLCSTDPNTDYSGNFTNVMASGTLCSTDPITDYNSNVSSVLGPEWEFWAMVAVVLGGGIAADVIHRFLGDPTKRTTNSMAYPPGHLNELEEFKVRS